MDFDDDLPDVDFCIPTLSSNVLEQPLKSIQSSTKNINKTVKREYFSEENLNELINNSPFEKLKKKQSEILNRSSLDTSLRTEEVSFTYRTKENKSLELTSNSISSEANSGLECLSLSDEDLPDIGDEVAIPKNVSQCSTPHTKPMTVGGSSASTTTPMTHTSRQSTAATAQSSKSTNMDADVTHMTQKGPFCRSVQHQISPEDKVVKSNSLYCKSRIHTKIRDKKQPLIHNFLTSSSKWKNSKHFPDEVSIVENINIPSSVNIGNGNVDNEVIVITKPNGRRYVNVGSDVTVISSSNGQRYENVGNEVTVISSSDDERCGNVGNEVMVISPSDDQRYGNVGNEVTVVSTSNSQSCSYGNVSPDLEVINNEQDSSVMELSHYMPHKFGRFPDLNRLKRKESRSNIRNTTVKQKTAQFQFFLDKVMQTVGLKNLKKNFSCNYHKDNRYNKWGGYELCHLCYWSVNLELAFNQLSVQRKMIRKWLTMSRRALDEKRFIRETLSQLNFNANDRVVLESYGPFFWEVNDQQQTSTNLEDDLLTGIKQGQVSQQQFAAGVQHAEPDDVEEDNLGVIETYADYMPAKLKIGLKHPDQVVETASMSSVEPPDVWYTLSLPASTIDSGKLSALQLESIVYASQQHSHTLPDQCRAGFLVGDGAGVGKGRTVAGIIYENWLKGRTKAIWVSVSNDLKYDAERDLKDIGAEHISVYSLNKMKYAKLDSASNGRIQRGIVFSTYSSLIGSTSVTTAQCRTRLLQLLQWCGSDFDGCIIFDECHRAKNLCPVGKRKPTKTGLTVLELQNRLPKARVVYASATGASEPKNMAYMVRLGIWGTGTPFHEFRDFISALEKRGVGAMEIVAMDMKLRGMYIARQLSFHGVTFKTEEVPLDEKLKKTYDESVNMVRNNREYAVLVLCCSSLRQSNVPGTVTSRNTDNFLIFRPNTGQQMRHEMWLDVHRKYTKITPEKAQPLWQMQYDASATQCSHVYGSGSCKRRRQGYPCHVALRTVTYHVLCGALLSIWTQVEELLYNSDETSARAMQVVRCKTASGHRMVGTLIPNFRVTDLIEMLSEFASNMKDENLGENDEINTAKSDKTAVSEEEKATQFKDAAHLDSDKTLLSPSQTIPSVENIGSEIIPVNNSDADTSNIALTVSTKTMLDSSETFVKPELKLSKDEVKDETLHKLMQDNTTVKDEKNAIPLAYVKEEISSDVVVKSDNLDSDVVESVAGTCLKPDIKPKLDIDLIEPILFSLDFEDNLISVTNHPEEKVTPGMFVSASTIDTSDNTEDSSEVTVAPETLSEHLSGTVDFQTAGTVAPDTPIVVSAIVQNAQLQNNTTTAQSLEDLRCPSADLTGSKSMISSSNADGRASNCSMLVYNQIQDCTFEDISNIACNDFSAVLPLNTEQNDHTASNPNSTVLDTPTSNFLVNSVREVASLPDTLDSGVGCVASRQRTSSDLNYCPQKENDPHSGEEPITLASYDTIPSYTHQPDQPPVKLNKIISSATAKPVTVLTESSLGNSSEHYLPVTTWHAHQPPPKIKVITPTHLRRSVRARRGPNKFE